MRAYHGVLQAKGLQPHRPLEKDLELTDQAMSYGGGSARRATIEVRNNPLAEKRATAAENPSSNTPRSSSNPEVVSWPKLPGGAPDFAQMTSAQRVAYNEARLKRIFG